MDTITVNFKGMTITGTAFQVHETLRKLGYPIDMSDYYQSSSKGLIKISDMESTHLRNAIQKIYLDWVQNTLRRITDPSLYVKAVLDGIQDKTWRKMVVELSTRP